MSSPARSWVGHNGNTIYLEYADDMAVYEYQVIEKEKVLLKSLTNTQFTTSITPATTSIEINFNTIPNGYLEYTVSHTTTYTVTFSTLETSVVGKSGIIIFKLSSGGSGTNAPTFTFSTSMSGRAWHAAYGSISSPYLVDTDDRCIMQYVIINDTSVFINMLADQIKNITS